MDQKTPRWIRKLTKRKESKDKDSYHQASGEGDQKWRQFTQSEGRKSKVLNPQVVNGARLHDFEQLRMIFHPLNVKAITRPKMKNRNRICNRFHSVEACFHTVETAKDTSSSTKTKLQATSSTFKQQELPELLSNKRETPHVTRTKQDKPAIKHSYKNRKVSKEVRKQTAV